ncbi:kinase-like domain-containing protein [Xylariaceae sp. FL0016]|nr:kinase-like domain-containing protein [Xylariaceae sp. FL0016]
MIRFIQTGTQSLCIFRYKSVVTHLSRLRSPSALQPQSYSAFIKIDVKMQTSQPIARNKIVKDDFTLFLKIDYNLVTEIEELGGRQFLPVDKFPEIFTRTGIEEALRESQVQRSDTLVDYILREAVAVFATLVYTDNVQAIQGLKAEGFSDQHLPVGKPQTKDGQHHLRDIRTLNERTGDLGLRNWKVFNKWRLPQVKHFIETQWKFLAATFDGTFSQKLDASRPLPFTTKISGYENRGHFSLVCRVGVPRALTNSRLFPDNIALKIFRPDLESEFRKELDTLENIKLLNHPHLIKPIAAVERGMSRCFLFPWAQGGNLHDYWERNDVRTEKVVYWTLDQIRGLCDCLKLLWSKNCRHGDLKPENILYGGDRKGFLIADVGVAKFHKTETDERDQSSSAKFNTRRYAAPEWEYNRKKGKPMSRDSDMWSVGVVLLEWLVWLRFGWEELKGAPDRFYTVTNHKFEVDSRAKEMMTKLAQDFPARSALHDVLDLVRTGLLVIDQSDNPKPGNVQPKSRRMKATDLYKRMNDIVRRTKDDRSYESGFRTWRARQGPWRTTTELELRQVL